MSATIVDIDSLARQTTHAVTRRTSMATLGITAFGAAIAGTQRVEAGKGAKQAKKKCKKQRGQCRAAIARACGDVVSCLEDGLPCCDFFARCNARAAVPCLVQLL